MFSQIEFLTPTLKNRKYMFSILFTLNAKFYHMIKVIKLTQWTGS